MCNVLAINRWMVLATRGTADHLDHLVASPTCFTRILAHLKDSGQLRTRAFPVELLPTLESKFERFQNCRKFFVANFLAEIGSGFAVSDTVLGKYETRMECSLLVEDF